LEKLRASLDSQGGGCPRLCRVLVLTRRVGENVIVGDDIVISVVEVRGDVVRLGIKAPRSVSVHREEVYVELKLAGKSDASDDVVEPRVREA
jgi:carbon storage regulator